MKIALFDSEHSYNLDTPYNEPLGGTESAIVYFLEEMKTRDHDVYLFNKCDKIDNCRGVIQVPSSTYYDFIKNNKLHFDIIIVSRLPHELFNLKHRLNSPSTVFCLWTGHDIDQYVSTLLKEVMLRDAVDKYIFVSEWQRDRFIKEYNISKTKSMIMRNGIGKPFEKYLDMPTDKIERSTTYCSIPWRGLELLHPIFRIIHQKYSDATLDIFSGMNIYRMEDKNEQTNVYDEFKKLDGVSHSYGIGQNELANKLYNIEYLTYPNTFPETSCITVLQAMACGCLIVTSDLGALKETMNGMNRYVKLDLTNIDVNKYVQDFVIALDALMNLSENNKELLRQANRDYIKKNYTWSVICKKFEDDFEYLKTRPTIVNVAISR